MCFLKSMNEINFYLINLRKRSTFVNVKLSPKQGKELFVKKMDNQNAVDKLFHVSTQFFFFFFIRFGRKIFFFMLVQDDGKNLRRHQQIKRRSML